MKKRFLGILLTTILLGNLLSACSTNGEANGNKEAASNTPTTEATTTPDVTPSNSPEATVAPSDQATVAPDPTKAPAPSEEAAPSKKPAATKEPAATKKPTTTQKPESTKKPEATKKPVPTKQPEPTKKPTPTKAPETVTLPSATEMLSKILEKVEQPSLMDMDSDMIKDAYYMDMNLLSEFAVRAPMMNVKTNEIAIFKVKNVKDIDTVKTAIKKRAADIAKQFENYLQDQYENAKNYKIVTNGNHVMFIISESADDLEKEFGTFFKKK